MKCVSTLATTLATALMLIAIPAAQTRAAPPATKAECLQQSFSLAEQASKTKLAKEAAAKVEAALMKMEAACTANDFAKAQAAALEATSAMPGN